MERALTPILRAIMPTAVAGIGLYVSLVIAPIKLQLEHIHDSISKLEAKLDRHEERDGTLAADIARIQGQLAATTRRLQGNASVSDRPDASQ